MGMCIRVHGIFFPSIRAGLLIAGLLAMMTIPAAAQDVAESEPPGETAAPHWSPYTAPDLSSSEEQIYIIIRGDNLWNLAGQFYGDPLLWPQIWDANSYILDAHWIYPGDPLVIPEAPDVAAQRMVGGEDEFGEEPMPGDAVGDLEGEPVPPGEMVDPDGDDALAGLALSESPGALVNPVDVYCAPLIAPDLDRYKHAISGAEEMDKVTQSFDDVIYLDGGEDDGIHAGDRFFVHHKNVKVKHPDSGRHMGWALRQIAELEVLCANAHDATALITHACAEVVMGDLIVPHEDLPIPVVDPTAPLGVCDEPSDDEDGFLVYIQDDQWAAATGNIAVIDKGSDDGVGPGDFFTVFRFQEGHQLVLGEALVLLTERDTATVKLISSYRAIYVGDRVNLK